MKSADQSWVRVQNQKMILESIYEKKETSRAELARDLSMSKPAMADNLNVLLKNGIVEEIGISKTNKLRGRNPIIIRFCKEHKYIFAIDLSFKDPLIALGNLAGEILEETSVKIPQKATPAARKEMVRKAINDLLHSNNLEENSLCYIAVSAPGVFFQKDSPALANQQFLLWFEEDIFPRISREIGVHFFIKNDANTAAIGEYIYGSGTDSVNMLYLSCGLGVGSGIILNSQLFEGSYGAAGEIHNMIDPQKLKLGKNLENTVSIHALIQRVKEDILANTAHSFAGIDPEKLEFEHIVSAYRQHDAYIMDLLRNICVEIGCTIANIANILTIDTVVMGGEYIIFEDILLRTVKEITEANCPYRPNVVLSKLGRYAGIYGLFGIVRDKYFDEVSSGAAV